jgi:DNA repair exonuclease SbcCD ATPase subunit
MLKVKKLRFSNIGRFVGDHEICFDDKSNFIQVDSNNFNTGGSSGGGKSTLFLAVEYALGLNDTPTTVLQSRLTKSAMSAELVIDKDGKEYVIRRHKSEGLSISGSGVDVSGSTKVAEEELDRVLGIPRSLLRPMFHKRQGERGFFLSKTPKQSHEFLMECLGMKSIEAKIEKIEVAAKEKESGILTTDITLAADKDALQTTMGVLSTIREPKCDVDERALESVLGRLSDLREAKTALASELAGKLATLHEPEPMPYIEDRKLTEALSLHQMDFEMVSSSYRAIENDLNHLKTNISVNSNHVKISTAAIESKDEIASELNRLKLQITDALKKKCPTCLQHIESENVINSVMASFVATAQKKKAEYDAIVAMEERLPSILASLEEDTLRSAELIDLKSTAEKQIEEVKCKVAAVNRAREKAREESIGVMQAAMKSFRVQRDEIALSYGDRFLQLDNQIEAYNQAYHKGQANLKSYADAMKSYDAQKTLSESRLSALRDKIGVAETRSLAQNKELKTMRAATKFLKSYANQLFQESLAVVADTATKILSRVSNMNTATITFDAFKETKAGSIKEEIVPILSLDDEINIPIKSMSGGERAAVDLAVDLAVIDMIESQTGNGIDLFVLDEPFDGLDAICRENCLEVLKNHASQRKILIVDHSTETKQMVQDKIIVIRDGQTSRLDGTLQMETQ